MGDEHEAELENFRQKWREEVQQRERPSQKFKDQPSSSDNASSGTGLRKNKVPPSVAGPSRRTDEDGLEPQAFHDLEDKDEALRLRHQGPTKKVRNKDWQPRSALEHYEKAVETESEGKLGDSVGLYRRAFKLDSGVHEAYKQKHFPPSSFVQSRPQDINPSNASPTVPNPAHHSLHGSENGEVKDQVSQPVLMNVADLIDSFSNLSIPGAEPETSLSKAPPCPISRIPDEILMEILIFAAGSDVSALSRLALVCKQLAYLIVSDDRLWKQVCCGQVFGLAAMHYSYACDLNGLALPHLLQTPSTPVAPPLSLVPDRYSTFRAQFRHRPRIRFGGCYISTVNYTRQGAPSQDARTWYNPVHIVTYYRYLRFFRDGRVISLLTTAEPQDVVHHITWENVHTRHGQGLLPNAVMKEALAGRWRLSGATLPNEEPGPDVGHSTGAISENTSNTLPLEDFEAPGPGYYKHEPNADFPEPEGDVFIETNGVAPKYMWKMHFALGSSGRKDGTRNNRLTWKSFWSYDRLADDWGEFGLKNYRSFYWSRVKSYSLR